MSHTTSEVHLLPDNDPTRMRAILTNDNGVLLAYVGRGMPNDENARRIVALWNACRGIETDVLLGMQDGHIKRLLEADRGATS